MHEGQLKPDALAWWLEMWEGLAEVLLPDPKPTFPPEGKRNFADGGDCKGERVQA